MSVRNKKKNARICSKRRAEKRQVRSRAAKRTWRFEKRMQKESESRIA